MVYDPGGFLSVGQRPLSRRCQGNIKSLIDPISKCQDKEYHRCQDKEYHRDIEGDVTPTSLQYRNVHWV